MARGGINHLALTLSDLKRSETAFYAPVLGFLGYEKVEDAGAMTLWFSGEAGVAINLWQAGRAGEGRADRTRPGFHHCAFAVDTRDDVDRCHDLALREGIEVLDAPTEYDYAPGYYAVFFADPDGMKFEVVHMPAVPD